MAVAPGFSRITFEWRNDPNYCVMIVLLEERLVSGAMIKFLFKAIVPDILRWVQVYYFLH